MRVGGRSTVDRRTRHVSWGSSVRRIAIALLVVASTTVVGVSSPPSVAGAATNWDPSGQAMPVGNLPGWHQIFADNFANDSVARGSFTGCNIHGCTGAPSVPWGAIPDGHPDTSGHCQYYPSQTVSILKGVLDINMHTVSDGLCMDASLYPLVPSQTYGMYQVRFRSANVPGYKGVYLLWPVDKTSGEIDFPEANLDAPLKGFLHTIAGGSQQQSFKSTASWTSWHTATLEWTPTSVTFILDGTVLGSTTLDVPQTPMTLLLIAESDLQGAPKPPASAQGSMEIDWLTVYTYAP
jgi:Glycosyl hydrolases family 16